MDLELIVIAPMFPPCIFMSSDNRGNSRSELCGVLGATELVELTVAVASKLAAAAAAAASWLFKPLRCCCMSVCAGGQSGLSLTDRPTD